MNKLIVILGIGVTVTLTGCVTPVRPDITYIRHMPVDCRNKDAQDAYLVRQLEYESTKTTGSSKERALYNREQIATIKNLLWDVRSKCQ